MRGNSMGNALSAVIDQIIMLFIIAGIGLFMRKKGIFTDEVIKNVNTFVLQVTWPCIAVMAMMTEYTQETLHGFLVVAGISVFAMLLGCGIGGLAFSKNKDASRRPVLMCISAIPNAGFIGLPIMQALYGEIGVLYMAAFLVGFNLVVWTVGAAMYQGFSIKTLKGFLSPGSIGIFVGLFIFLLRIELPGAVSSTITALGRLNTPLAMLLMGARMDTLRPRDLLDKNIWAAAGLKLVVLPLILFAALKLLGFSGILLAAPVVLAAMPAASISQMFAEKFNADSRFAAKGVSMSTLLCILTVPLLSLLVS